MENRGALCECIITYNALQKRKVYLDAIAEGLNEFGVFDAIKCFPDLLAGLFIPSAEITVSDVVKILKFPKAMTKKELAVADLLKDCLKELTQSGE